ncbi:hypothetical protein Pcinc_037805 [Petrolisthes cinctipes]|uniref:Methylated-DNA--protein-cysteine methyltransferase n=1 Tax=Petrolisthes cinctipes TaxID=88211 RepID=A0AAE1EKZ9_PETCI|nr:hypothetical protein Pcinc_037805 [Petrolisthes cinctipes]
MAYFTLTDICSFLYLGDMTDVFWFVYILCWFFPDVKKMAQVRKESKWCENKETAYHITSPLGTITIKACNIGMHSLSQPPHLNDENFSPNKRTEVELVQEDKEFTTPPPVIKDCLYWLQVYFKNPSQVSQVPFPTICHLQSQNLSFRARVWQTLADTVGPGEVITYGALATRLRNPGAARSVGSAMSHNPVGIIVPCHRVVRSSDLGLYHGGQRQKVKLWLLKHEGVDKF